MQETIIKPPTPSRWQKFKEEFGKRNAWDYLTITIAFLALLTPFIIRFCDHRSAEPKISMTTKVCKALSFKYYPELQSSLPLALEEQPTWTRVGEEGRILLADWIDNFAKLYLITVLIENQRNTPVSLHNLRIEDLRIESEYNGFSSISKIFFHDSSDYRNLKTHCILDLAPNQSIQVELIIPVFLTATNPVARAKLHTESLAYLAAIRKTNAAPIDLSHEVVWLSEEGEKYNTLKDLKKPDAAPFVLAGIISKYWEKTHLSSIQFAVTDNHGQTHLSNYASF